MLKNSTVGHSREIRRTYFDGNRTGQSGERRVASQNDTYPGNEAKN